MHENIFMNNSYTQLIVMKPQFNENGMIKMGFHPFEISMNCSRVWKLS